MKQNTYRNQTRQVRTKTWSLTGYKMLENVLSLFSLTFLIYQINIYLVQFYVDYKQYTKHKLLRGFFLFTIISLSSRSMPGA